MQCGQHQVTRQRRLHRNLRGFGIPHLTDHDDVGVLPENGAERAGKGQVDLGLHGNLINTLKLVFDRVFHSNNLQGI